MIAKEKYLLTAILTLVILICSLSPAQASEMWLVWSDYNQEGNPIYLSRFEQGEWLTENFSPGQFFEANFAPCPGIDRGGNPWVVWAARIDESPPGIYYSFRKNNVWSDPRRVEESSERWECTPTIAFDREGNPVAAWSGVVGESTEIFCANWKNGGFLPAVMVSQSDGSPDSLPSLAPGDDGSPVAVWEGWEDGHARIFQSRFGNGFWSPEAAVDPQPDIDQILPAARRSGEDRLAITWWENGNAVTFEAGKTDVRKAGRSFSRQLASPGFPEPDSGAWLLFRNPAGSFGAYRYRTLLSPPPRRTAALPPRRSLLATDYYIGYGNSITYGHYNGSDTNGWYGSLLASMLSAIYPGHSFHSYNEGYPAAETNDLLNGPGHPDWPCPGINSVIDSRPLATKILIMGGTNDIGHGLALSSTKYYLGQMVDRARVRGVDPILGTIIPRVDRTDNYNRSTDLCTNYIPPLALEKSCTLANPWQVYMQYWDTDYFWHDLYGYPNNWDGVHPTWVTGHQEIANAWYDAFIPPTPSPSPSPSPTPGILMLDSDDYDGDGTSDISIFRPSSGLWGIRGVTRVYFGVQGDIPVPGDYNNDGVTDIGIFRQSQGLWAIRGISRFYYGGSSDLPVPGDYNGSGRCNFGIFRESSGLWAIKDVTRSYFGMNGDRAVPGYYSGSRTKDIAVFRPSTGLWAILNISRIYFGTGTDLPVPASYGPGRAWQPAIFRGSTSLWAIRGVSRFYFGISTDQAEPGDFQGDGVEEAAIFRKSSGLWAINNGERIYFGRNGDTPLAARVPYPITPTPTPPPTSTPTPPPTSTPTPPPTSTPTPPPTPIPPPPATATPTPVPTATPSPTTTATPTPVPTATPYPSPTTTP